MNRKAVLAIILVISSVGTMANGPVKVKTTADRVLKQLQGAQAAHYASALYSDAQRWGYVSDEIASGDTRWLRVATSLNQYADGAFSEELETDLALALARRPKNVLTMLRHQSGPKRFEAKLVCAAPMPSPGKLRLRKYRKEAIAAVRSVRGPELRTLRDDCLQTLRNIDLSQPADAYQ